ncbi:MAG: hypothetical protein AAF514_20360, partial [Verrucomicrobiota bacterium]
GRYLDYSKGKISVETRDNRTEVLEVAKLDKESMRQARHFAGAGIAPKPTLKKKPGGLPSPSAQQKMKGYGLKVFTSGPAKGAHALYQHEKFDAVVQGNGHLHILMKEKGKRIPKIKPVILKPHLNYRKNKEWVGRVIEKVSSEASAATQPSLITYSGVSEEGVIFTQNYRFRGTEISGWGFCRDPKDIPQPTSFHQSTSVRPMHELTPEMEAPEVARLVAGSYLKVKPYSGRKRDLPFEEKIAFALDDLHSNPVETAHLHASTWGSRSLVYEAPSLKHGKLLFWNRGKRYHSTGINLSYHKADPASKSKQAVLTLTIR